MKNEDKRLWVYALLYAEFIIALSVCVFLASLGFGVLFLWLIIIALMIIIDSVLVIINHSLFRLIVRQKEMFIFESLLIITQIIVLIVIAGVGIFPVFKQLVYAFAYYPI